MIITIKLCIVFGVKEISIFSLIRARGSYFFSVLHFPVLLMETVPLLETVQLLFQGGNMILSVTFIYTKCSVIYETWAEKTNIRVNFEKMSFWRFFVST